MGATRTWKTLERIDNIILVLCFSIFLTLPFLAQPVSAGADDTNLKECGGEAVELYHGVYGLKDLTYTIDNTEYFLSGLTSIGWTKKFFYKNDAAWESDFEKSGVGGQDYIYIDTCDFVYFDGHGWPDSFFFGTNHDADGVYPYQVHYSEVNWGDLDLEWIVIDACNVLQYEPTGFLKVTSRWGFPVFKGLHAILGFDTITLDVETTGMYFVYYLVEPKTIGDAWVAATRAVYPSAIYGAALGVYNTATGYIGYRDYLPGYGTVGSDIDSPSSFAWMTWQC